jgi:hypothetical protein
MVEHTPAEMAAFGASDAACVLYSGANQQPERAAYCQGAQDAVAHLSAAQKAASELLAAHLAWEKAEDDRNDCDECENEGPWEHCSACSLRFGDAIDMRHAALALATPEPSHDR